MLGPSRKVVKVLDLRSLVAANLTSIELRSCWDWLRGTVSAFAKSNSTSHGSSSSSSSNRGGVIFGEVFAGTVGMTVSNDPCCTKPKGLYLLSSSTTQTSAVLYPGTPAHSRAYRVTSIPASQLSSSLWQALAQSDRH